MKMRIARLLALSAAALALGAATASLATAAPPLVRGCADSVYGDIGSPARWHRYSAVAGPLALIGLHDAARATPAALRAAYRQGHGAFKVLAIVKRHRAVTLTVPAWERGHVALLYDGSRFAAPQTVANGEQAVTFRACAGGATAWSRATQWPGGVVVDGPRCVTLSVRVLPRGPTRRVRQAFGPVVCPP